MEQILDKNNLNKKRETAFFVIFFLSLLTNSLRHTENKTFQDIGDFSSYIGLFLMFLLLIVSLIRTRQGTQPIGRIYVAFFILVSIYIVSYFSTSWMEASDFWKSIFLLLFVLGSLRMKWRELHIKVAGYVFSSVILLFFLHWMISGFPLFAFQSIYANENYLAALLFSLLFFIILAVKYSRGAEKFYFLGVLLCNLTLLLTTSARSVLVGLFIAIVAWVVIKQGKKVSQYLFYIIVLGVTLFITTYIHLRGTWLGNQLNDLSRSLFNKKNLFSGRSEIWEKITSAVAKEPLFGFGAGVRPQEVAGTQLGAHSLYLQMLLEIGFIGLAAFIVFLLFIWTNLRKRSEYFVARWAACFMLAILVYESMELTLHPNNYSIAMLQWLILTIGINFTAEKPQFTSRIDKNRVNHY